MKEIFDGLALAVIGTAAVLLLVGVGLGMIYGLRVFSEATVSVTVIEPTPGIRCAKLITSDGAAISCWKD